MTISDEEMKDYKSECAAFGVDDQGRPGMDMNDEACKLCKKEVPDLYDACAKVGLENSIMENMGFETEQDKTDVKTEQNVRQDETNIEIEQNVEPIEVNTERKPFIKIIAEAFHLHNTMSRKELLTYMETYGQGSKNSRNCILSLALNFGVALGVIKQDEKNYTFVR